MQHKNTLLERLGDLLRNLASGQPLVSKSIATVLGRVVFRLSLTAKRIGLLFGLVNQRSVEYPWLISSLQVLKNGATILDVGCAESLLSHELLARGYCVVGIDLRDYPWKSPRMSFYKRDARNTRFPSDFFDAVISVSTLEHIGLCAYGQLSLDDEGDIKAMEEFRRILKDGGFLFLTVPYIGNGPFKLNQFERSYNEEHVKRLTRGFDVVNKDCFLSIRKGKRWIWLKTEKVPTNSFKSVGLACLTLTRSMRPRNN